MWKLFKRRVSGGHVNSAFPAGDSSYYVYRVQLRGGLRDVVSLLPPDLVFRSGSAGEAIVGGCTRLLDEGEFITEANFKPNRAFVNLLHEVIAREAPMLADFQAEARRQRTGWIYVIDARTPTPAEEVPAHDIIGAFEVTDGTLTRESYRSNANHRLFSSDGFFKLEPRLHKKLVDRLMRHAMQSPRSTA